MGPDEESEEEPNVEEEQEMSHGGWIYTKVYRRLSRAPDERALRAAVENAEDRFGPLPPSARLLVSLARLRIAAAALLIEHVVRIAPDRVSIRPRDMGRLLAGLDPVRSRVRVVDQHAVHLLLEDPGEDGPELLADLQNALVPGNEGS